MDRYLDRSDYQLLEMDTDSSYLALSKHSFEELVKPELDDEYRESRRGKSVCTDTPPPIFFQRECCKKHEAWDKRTPGLFKIEFLAEDMYSLSSKTYFARNQGMAKLSCKGINKRFVQNPLQVFLDVLEKRESKQSENKSIILKGTSLYTY